MDYPLAINAHHIGHNENKLNTSNPVKTAEIEIILFIFYLNQYFTKALLEIHA